MQLNEQIWQGGPAEDILMKARIRYERDKYTDQKGALIALASVFYSLAKRYRGWKALLGAIYLWQGASYVKQTLEVSDDVRDYTLDQIDVITRILYKTPWYLGGSRARALPLLEQAIRGHSGWFPAKPHTRALMLLTLAQMFADRGEMREAMDAFNKIRLDEVRNENSADRYQQLSRVLASYGFFVIDHGLPSERDRAVDQVYEALELAGTYAKDQAPKIQHELWRRRLDVP